MSLKSVTADIPDKKKKVIKTGSKLSLLPKVPKHIKESVSLYITESVKAKEAKARAEQVGEIIVDHALEIQNQEGYKGTYEKSYLIPGLKSELDKDAEEPFVQYSRSDKFSAFDDDKVVSALRKTLGAGTFNLLFEKKLELSISQEVFKSKDKVKELAALLTSAFGDRLGEFFVKQESYVAKEGLDTAQFNLGATPAEKKENYEAIQTLVKQNKPALKLT